MQISKYVAVVTSILALAVIIPIAGAMGSGFFSEVFSHVGQWGTHVDPNQRISLKDFALLIKLIPKK